MRFETRILCVALLIVCTASSCTSRRSSQWGQGHTSLLDYYRCKSHPYHGHGHDCHPGACAEGPCARGPCDVDYDGHYGHSVAPQQAPPQTAPPPPPEPTTRVIRPRRSRSDRSDEAIELSIPLPSRWIGNSESSAESPEPEPPEETIPWNNAPVATATEPRIAPDPDAPQVVGYEYALPAQLQPPEFDTTGFAGGHSLLNPR